MRRSCAFEVLAVLAWLVFGAGPSVFAQSLPPPGSPLPPIPDGSDQVLVQRPETIQTEVWVGGAFDAYSWFLYSGATQAVFSGVGQPGVRLRVAGGYGRYRYTGYIPIDNEAVRKRIAGQVTSFEALVGYQYHWRGLVTKAFIGVDSQTHVLAPADPTNAVRGAKYGVKLALENWLTLGERGFVSLDGVWSSVFSSYSAQFRAGYRVGSLRDVPVTLGVEAGVSGNRGFYAVRFGGLARFGTSYGDLSVSGGALSDDDGDFGYYVSSSFAVRF